VLAALDWRRRTGRGQLIEISQLETVIALLGEPYLEWTVNRRHAAPLGNRSQIFAPQGVYPAAGEDRWVALTVTDDAAWVALCAEIGRPGWAARYPDLDARRSHCDAIDEEIRRWTAAHGAQEGAERLQRAGVAAAPVCSAADQVDDPHLRARRAVEPVEHPVAGRHLHAGNPLHLSGIPAAQRRPAPLLGEATREICLELLGMPAEEYDAELVAGVFE